MEEVINVKMKEEMLEKIQILLAEELRRLKSLCVGTPPKADVDQQIKEVEKIITVIEVNKWMK